MVSKRVLSTDLAQPENAHIKSDVWRHVATNPQTDNLSSDCGHYEDNGKLLKMDQPPYTIKDSFRVNLSRLPAEFWVVRFVSSWHYLKKKRKRKKEPPVCVACNTIITIKHD